MIITIRYFIIQKQECYNLVILLFATFEENVISLQNVAIRDTSGLTDLMVRHCKNALENQSHFAAKATFQTNVSLIGMSSGMGIILEKVSSNVVIHVYVNYPDYMGFVSQ